MKYSWLVISLKQKTVKQSDNREPEGLRVLYIYCSNVRVLTNITLYSVEFISVVLHTHSKNPTNKNKPPKTPTKHQKKKPNPKPTTKEKPRKKHPQVPSSSIPSHNQKDFPLISQKYVNSSLKAKPKATGKTDTGKQAPDQDPCLFQQLLSSRAVSTEHSQMVFNCSLMLLKCP